jgi:hypothetical protein
MRLILEKNEIVAILGKHFDVELDPEKVIIKTDPLEIEVSGIPMTDAQPREETNVVTLRSGPGTYSAVKSSAVDPTDIVKKRDDPDATTEPPTPGDDDLGGPGQDLHPAAVLAASKALERQLEQENPLLKRRAGRGTSRAPEGFENEIT